MTAGVVYKLTCAGLAIAGFAVALHPFLLYFFIMSVSNLSNGGVAMLLILAGFLIVMGWGALRAFTRRSSTTLSSFVLPTLAGAMGVALIFVGVRFIQSPPGF